MPRGDGTGPLGYGPRSGRGMGCCSGYSMPGCANVRPGRRFWRHASPGPWFQQGAYRDEKTALRQQVDLLKEQLNMLEARLKEIENPETGE